VDRDDIIRMAREAGATVSSFHGRFVMYPDDIERFAALVAAHERKAFMEIIEPYLIPVDNSRSGEIACEWNVRTAKEKNT
jgi:hypothetical protein